MTTFSVDRRFNHKMYITTYQTDPASAGAGRQQVRGQRQPCRGGHVERDAVAERHAR